MRAHHLVIAALCLCVTCRLTHAAAPPRPPAVAVSDSMSLDQIASALKAYPPAWEFGDQRAKIFASLDKHVTVRAHKGWTDEERAALKPLHEFYLQRVDIGLDKLQRTRVTRGVHAFKFYSSSFAFKTSRGTVAVDFCQGPVNNRAEPEIADDHRSGFYLRPDQRDRLAKLVDVYLITHWHHDHSDYSLAKRMTAAGKTVIGPAQLKGLWKEFADKLTVPAYNTTQTFGPVQIHSMLGAQYAQNEPVGAGPERVGVPSTDRPERDAQTVVYLFKLAGITFLTSGENHVPSGEWAQRAAAAGFSPDVRLSLGQFQGERSMAAAIKSMPLLLRLPLHEYELTHHGGGNRTGHLLQGSYRAAFDRHECMPLLCGEDFLVVPKK